MKDDSYWYLQVFIVYLFFTLTHVYGILKGQMDLCPVSALDFRMVVDIISIDPDSSFRGVCYANLSLHR